MFSVPLYVSHAKIWEYSKFNVRYTRYSKWIADFEHRHQLAAQKLWLSIAQIWKFAKHQLLHCSDVIMRAIVSQTTGVWIVYATVVRPQNKENPKALRRWPLWGEFTSDRWISCTKASNVENVSIDDVIIMNENISQIPLSAVMEFDYRKINSFRSDKMVEKLQTATLIEVIIDYIPQILGD